MLTCTGAECVLGSLAPNAKRHLCARRRLSPGERALLEINAAVGEGSGCVKPGWTRVSIKYANTAEEVDFVVQAVKQVRTALRSRHTRALGASHGWPAWRAIFPHARVQVAEHGWKLLPLYELDRATGQWSLRKEAASIAKRAAIAARDAVAVRREKLQYRSVSQQGGCGLGALIKSLAPSCFVPGSTHDPATPPTTAGAGAATFLRGVKALEPLLAAVPAGVASVAANGATEAEAHVRALAEAGELLAAASRWVGELAAARKSGARGLAAEPPEPQGLSDWWVSSRDATTVLLSSCDGMANVELHQGVGKVGRE